MSQNPIEMLKGRMHGKSLRTLAKEIPCSAAYLSDVMNSKRAAGPRILGFLGVRRETETRVTYRRVNGRARK